MIKKLRDIAGSKSQLIQSEDYAERIAILSLASLSKIAINGDGKKECIKEEVIIMANHYLVSEIYHETYYASLLIMFCAVYFEGKEQCIFGGED